jgi:hypothetical protein
MKVGVRKPFVYFVMFVFVLAGYNTFYNTAYYGDKPVEGDADWMLGSTVKFVNNWLEDGACNLHFFMLECPKSIEYSSLYERGPYISYPPGAIIPPYLLAKALHKDQIQIDFVRQFLAIKYFLDTFLICLVFWGILTCYLKIKRIKWAAFISVVLSIFWMCLPINLVSLRNIYFSDECVITVILLFIWMEIYETYFRSKSMPVKSLYFILKFFIALAGVLTDYYFLFVIFIAWLIKIAPLFKLREKKVNSILVESLVYILPVLSGLSLFFMQISTVPDFLSKTKNVIEYRTYSEYSEHWNATIICRRFLRNYGLTGVLVVICFFVLVIKFVLSKSKINKNYLPFIKILLLIWIPPILHILIFQQHSAQHEISMVKFALPFILALSVILWYAFKRYKNTAFFYPLLVVSFIGTLILIDLSYFNNYYEKLQVGNYELEYLIRDNSKYEDVYFSLTDSIVDNPPVKLSISKKKIHKIGDVADIVRLFPNLDDKARILFVIRKDNSGKSEKIVERENNIIANSSLSFGNDNYNIYFYKKYEDGNFDIGS